MLKRSAVYLRLAMIFLIAVVSLQYAFWYGDNSVETLKETRALTANVNTHNQELIRINNVLKAEVMDLRTGSEVMEERARSELGLIKEGETFYRIIETDPANSSSFKNNSSIN